MGGDTILTWEFGSVRTGSLLLHSWLQECSLHWETTVFSGEDGTAGMSLPLVPPCLLTRTTTVELFELIRISVHGEIELNDSISNGSHFRDVDVKGLFLLGPWTKYFALVHMGTSPLHGSIITDFVLVCGWWIGHPLKKLSLSIHHWMASSHTGKGRPWGSVWGL